VRPSGLTAIDASQVELRRAEWCPGVPLSKVRARSAIKYRQCDVGACLNSIPYAYFARGAKCERLRLRPFVSLMSKSVGGCRDFDRQFGIAQPYRILAQGKARHFSHIADVLLRPDSGIARALRLVVPIAPLSKINFHLSEKYDAF
jgi:hypothetical protein